MSDIELKPCPFCGSKAVAFSYITEGAVRCGGCHAAITRGHKHASETGYEEAIAAWNTRATPLAEALAVPEVAALLADLKQGPMIGEPMEPWIRTMMARAAALISKGAADDRAVGSVE